MQSKKSAPKKTVAKTTAPEKTGKQKKSIKESIKATGSKAKDFAKKQVGKVKSSAKKYGSDIRTAYDIGYARGWEDAYNVPKRVGAKTVASYGFKKGLKNRPKSDKYIAQSKRKG